MSSQQTVAVQSLPQTRSMPWTAIGYLVIGVAALLPRVLDLGVFLTEDEANFWIRRSDQFLLALLSRDFAATAISDHPGVTTMWLGGMGILLRRALFAWGLVRDESFSTVIGLIRLPVALAHSAGILLGYGLLRRMLAPATAALAALFWAVDPFVVGFSRLLHVDALAGTFATLSLLAACHYWHHSGPRGSWALSAICAGLAMLSKQPAALVAPVVALIAFAATWRQPFAPRRFTRAAGPMLLWGVICAVTIFILWPALWANPVEAYGHLREGVMAEGAQPHQLGNYFMGRPDPAPGLLFYPVALALRLTPLTLVGILLLAVAWRRERTATRQDLAALAAFAVLFTVAMSLFPKKFNRYLVPIFPVLDILAAAGLAWAVERLATLRSKRPPPVAPARRLGTATALSSIGLLAALNMAWWHPYGIAAFNQALGGARTGARMFMAGWGEGLEQVAAWLNEQPDITGVEIGSTMIWALQPYLRQGAQAVFLESSTLPEKTGYVVIYGRHVQMDELGSPFREFYENATPVETINIRGVDYAWIYQAPPPVPQPRPADFGPSIHLRGFDVAEPLRRGQPLLVKLFWHARTPPPGDYMLFAHLIGPNGLRAAQVDLPHNTSAWRHERYVTTEAPLAVPSDAPPGTYRVVIGMYELATGARLPLKAAEPVDPRLDGPDALVLAELVLE